MLLVPVKRRGEPSAPGGQPLPSHGGAGTASVKDPFQIQSPGPVSSERLPSRKRAGMHCLALSKRSPGPAWARVQGTLTLSCISSGNKAPWSGISRK